MSEPRLRELQALRIEHLELRERLAEAEETLRAIHEGAVCSLSASAWPSSVAGWISRVRRAEGCG